MYRLDSALIKYVSAGQRRKWQGCMLRYHNRSTYFRGIHNKRWLNRNHRQYFSYIGKQRHWFCTHLPTFYPLMHMVRMCYPVIHNYLTPIATVMFSSLLVFLSVSNIMENVWMESHEICRVGELYTSAIRRGHFWDLRFLNYVWGSFALSQCS